MTNVQLYLSIGIPTLAVLFGILLNGYLYTALHYELEARMDSIGSRIASLETRMLSLETTMTARFDLIMGKLVDLDNRLAVLEDSGKH